MSKTIIDLAIIGAKHELRKARKAKDENLIKECRDYLIKIKEFSSISSVERIALNRKLRIGD